MRPSSAPHRLLLSLIPLAGEESVSHLVLSLFPSPQKSLGVPIEETPDVPWGDPADWVSVVKFGAQPLERGRGPDATEAVQKAIDSGAHTVYFPVGRYTIEGTVHIRGNVRRIIGLGQGAAIRGGGKFQLDDGPVPVVVVGNLQGTGSGVVHASRRTLVLRDMHLNALGGNAHYTNTGRGELFLEDVGGKTFTFTRQHVWARQLNAEPPTTKVTNDGGTLWLRGLKTERGGTLIHTKNGGTTELAGGFCYTTTDPQGTPMLLNEESAVSLFPGGEQVLAEVRALRPHRPRDPRRRDP